MWTKHAAFTLHSAWILPKVANLSSSLSLWNYFMKAKLYENKEPISHKKHPSDIMDTLLYGQIGRMDVSNYGEGEI